MEVFQWLTDLVLKHKVHPGPTDTTSLGAGNWWNLGKIGIRHVRHRHPGVRP